MSNQYLQQKKAKKENVSLLFMSFGGRGQRAKKRKKKVRVNKIEWTF